MTPYRPVSLAHRGRGVPDHREVEAVERHAAVPPTIDVERQRKVAVAVRGPGCHVARDAGAEEGTAARLEVVTRDLPRDLRHDRHLRPHLTIVDPEGQRAYGRSGSGPKPGGGTRRFVAAS